ncbi:hypothetical protein [Vibrio lentus]|uniref:Uncharacterized protein n=1 Tax=Vibrio lentus TaxID=136468 RepID=A0A2N7IDF6_9VIBR|nr:hypothetical protein [Vibrio lentus]PML54953.1 hypothetical protein BCT74_06365 [Vibrio lentus]
MIKIIEKIVNPLFTQEWICRYYAEKFFINKRIPRRLVGVTISGFIILSFMYIISLACIAELDFSQFPQSMLNKTWITEVISRSYEDIKYLILMYFYLFLVWLYQALTIINVIKPKGVAKYCPN